MPTSSSVRSTSSPRSLLEPRFQIVSGSITMSRTLRRGFSDEIGSWKIICIRVRAERMSFCDMCVRSLPSKTIEPDVGRGSCMIARPVVLLPQPDSPTRPSVSPRRRSKLIPDTALTLSPVRPTGNSHDEVLDAQHEVVVVAQVGLAGAGHQERLLAGDRPSGSPPSSARREWYSGESTGYQQANR